MTVLLENGPNILLAVWCVQVWIVTDNCSALQQGLFFNVGELFFAIELSIEGGMDVKSVSIVVPVYNEQENIDVFYREVCLYMEPLPYRFELIFIDDGSTDATPIILDR